MPHVYQFPRYGFQRPGTQHYEFGGHAYGAWRGLGDGRPTTPAAVAMVPEPAALPVAASRGIDRAALSRALAQRAREAQANAFAAAALNNPFAYRAQHAAAVALKTRAVQVGRGFAGFGGGFRGFGIDPDVTDIAVPVPVDEHGRPLEHPGQGRGVGLAKVKEWWATRTPGQKAATVGAGVGLAWAVGLL